MALSREAGHDCFPRIGRGLDVVVLSAILFLPSAWGQYHLEVVSSKKLNVCCQISAAGHATDSPAHLLLPALPTRDSQQMDSLDLSVPSKVISDQSDPPKSLLSAWVKNQAGESSFYRRYYASLNITANLQQRQLVAGPGAPVNPLSPTEEARFLGVTPTLNWRDTRFDSWLSAPDLRRKQQELPVDYGRRLYNYLLHHASYEYPPVTGWDAAATCTRLQTDCGGISGVFVSACRANHIPARLLIGQWFRLTSMAGKHPGVQPHVYAEFFDPTVGWVPVDIASALIFADSGSIRTDFFGMDPPYFLVLTYDTDFQLDTPSDGVQKIQWMQSPNLWFYHKNSDSLAVSRHWSYTVAEK